MSEVLKLFTNKRVLIIRFLLRLFGIKISKEQLLQLVESQTEKGIDKYNRTIIDCRHDAYDWQKMATEEIIDFYLYVLKHKKII
jgi:hypothetical protein